MMSPPPQHQVLRLSTIAFHSVVKESYRHSGCFEAMVDYVHGHHLHLRDQSNEALKSNSSFRISVSAEANRNLVRRILQMDKLPRHLVIELANCMMEYQKSFAQFANSITTSLTWLTRDNVMALCECIAVLPDGVLDKRRTILNAVGSRETFDCSGEFVASFYCVNPASAVEEYKRRAAEGKYYPHLSYYMNLSDPLKVWLHKQATARMEGLFYECVTIQGPWEAMEYFYYASDPSIRQRELSKAASCIEHQEISADKILFFRKHLEPSAWRTVLKRCFYKIFCTIFKNHRYKHICVTLYRDVCEELDGKVIFNCLNAIDTHIVEHYWDPLKMQLLLADLEPIFISLWQSIPVSHRKNSGISVFKIFRTLLIHRKAEALAVLVQDIEAFTAKRRKELAGCAAIALIVNGEQERVVLDFINKICPETYDVNSVKDELVTLDSFITFIVFYDRCCNMYTYDQILKFKYTTEFSFEVAKKYLIFNGQVNHIILQALEQKIFCIKHFEAFLNWVFNNQRTQVERYLRSCQQPPNLLTEIYKLYITSSRRSMYTIPAFQQSDEVTQKIRRQIAMDYNTLYAYCHTLILTRDYSALPRMLTSVFTHERERELFLSGFFFSKLGVDSIYHMLMSPAYDTKYFVRFVFKEKLNEFLEFRQHWILNQNITAVLDLVMNGYGRAPVVREESYQREIKEQVKLEIMPHESVEEVSHVYDVNIAIFKCVLRNSFVVDMFHALANVQ